MREINAVEFKVKCLEILDELTQVGESVTIFNQGKPVPQLIPLNPYGYQFPQQELMGAVSILGDVVSPTLPSGEWCSEAAFPS